MCEEAKYPKVVTKKGYFNNITTVYKTQSSSRSFQSVSTHPAFLRAKKWTMPIKNWTLALNQFEIICGDFKQELIESKI